MTFDLIIKKKRKRAGANFGEGGPEKLTMALWSNLCRHNVPRLNSKHSNHTSIVSLGVF